jgi:aspartyl-tRNA(Asn)/glutamyl-tRNA(Gln) amidotransferase subunit C
MAISEQDVKRIARLARIQLPPEEALQTQKDLARILDLMARLQAVDTQGVEPMAHPLSGHQDIQLRLREDVPAPAHTEEQRSELMSNAPAQSGGLFLVPTVIE